MNLLTLNAGSNSLKFEIIAADPGPQNRFGNSVVAGVFDDIGKDNASFSLLDGKNPRNQERQEIKDHGHATDLLFEWLKQNHTSDIHRVVHRVVHGADLFHGAEKITPEVIQRIESLQDLAPLHNASALKVIHAAAGKTDAENIAVFDTVFHQTIPDHAATYALPHELAKRHRIRRYGFHGLSHRYMMLRYAELSGRAPEDLNLITLHLEGGSSAAAIRKSKSIDTSMGFTPLEGLMMGTRTGDLDPAIVTYLMRKESLDIDGIEKLLNKQSGLQGLSGVSADTRELMKQVEDSHPEAPQVRLTLDVFSYRVRKYVGAYLAALGGADAIVIGGGIGENTAYVRERICHNLDFFGAEFDANRNNSANDREAAITTPESKLQIWVVPTQEGLMMARESAEWKP